MNRGIIPLDQIRVASPCRTSWDRMAGDGRVRYCGQCEKNVYNLSGMTRHEAEDLIARNEGRLCVRFFRRADGTVLTQDCPVGRHQAVQRWVLLFGGLASGFLIAALSLLTAGAFVLPRLRDDGRPLPNPVEQIMDWIFPPAPVMGAPCPPAPNPPPGPPAPDAPDGVELPNHE
jgi:hypothetical protein